ncbi:MAG TPA: hypothetical protein VET26_12260 [Candidatus Sulfotelmatobacter sp.]|nr:hypothetical protein [Candidatus Sulfotelmatobacter sp.]
MSNRLDYYFRQRVTEAELDLGFAELEQADQNQAADLGFTGVLANAVVSQHAPVADLTIDVSGPGAILDQLGQRIFFSALQNVNVAQDDNGVSTDVSGAGKEKVVSVFVKFDRALSDPRVDGNSLTVFFRRDESFKFIVVQGAEAPAGTAILPPLRSDAILLADVTRSFGQTQVLAGIISIARRQDAFVLNGSPRSIRRGRTIDALKDLLTYFNALANGTGDRLAASYVDYAGGGSWADGTTNPATTVEAQLDKLVSDLAATSGAPKVGAAATAGAPNALAAGTVKSQLDTLLGFLNAHINQAAGAHAATAISYAGGGNWADGTTNPATTVEAQLDKIVSDLAGAGGADKVGATIASTWADGAALPSTRVKTSFDRIVSDLAAATGASKIGAAATAGAPNALVAGSVKSQLDALLGFINAHINLAAGAHAGSAISYAAGPAWKDGTTNPATTVQAELDKHVNDLVADAGASRIGITARTAWLGGRANPASVSIFAAIDKIITDLAAQTAADDGAKRIGAQASGNLPVGSVRSQLDSLDATSVRTNVANIFTAKQTFNGAAGDTNAAIATTSAPSTRKLLWEITGTGNYNYRLYAASRTLEFTLNAQWNGTQWVKDSTAWISAKLELNNFQFRIRTDNAATSPFADTAWTGTIDMEFQTGNSLTLDVNGNWTSPGTTETYIAWQGLSPASGNTNVGSGAPFRKVFPATPSSITFTTLDSPNLTSGPFSWMAAASGTGAFIGTNANTSARFYARVTAS